jgi:hypothetical protein
MPERSRQGANRSSRTDSNNGISFAPVLTGLVACAKCAAVILDTDAAKTAHSRFHDGLRALWERGR